MDRLNDGYSAFKYTPPQLVSATNLVALLGSALYGETVPGTFDPPCDAYARGARDETYLRAYTILNPNPVASLSFQTTSSVPYPIEAYVFYPAVRHTIIQGSSFKLTY